MAPSAGKSPPGTHSIGTQQQQQQQLKMTTEIAVGPAQPKVRLINASKNICK